MKPPHHAKVQLQHASLPCRHNLLLRRVDHERLRLWSWRIKISNLLGGQRSRSRKCSKQSCQHNLPPHHCPPAATVVPEAIVFLMCASISSLLPSPAVCSPTTPFLST